MSVRIGNITIDNPVALGPMAGVTDLPFRVLCKEQGCGLLYTEMVSAKALHFNNENTKTLMEIDKSEHPIVLQLFGSDPNIIAAQAHRYEDGPWDIFDLNMGCPVPKVVNNGEGSALMKNPPLVREILTKLVRAVDKPVTIKIRRGFTVEGENAVEIAKIAEDCGVAAIAVHGRTRSQFYAGSADRECIRRVKEAVSIPVIGNGDITSGQDAKSMMDETGCDMVMIARGAKGNPWLFREVTQYLKDQTVPARPTWEEIRHTILRHSQMMVECKGEYIAVQEMRKHIAWYTAGLKGASALRRQINQTETLEDLINLVNSMNLG
ncbi:MAG: tRNA dihydrouridine synthase DusB [Lachnospiraceae bacterium]|nr:tRNA dihydrouridine synthase DusB [Lachnospiraceae bacterium]